jgi:hypothetical protein
MELVEFHFRSRLDFTGQSPGWYEVENFPSFIIGKALDHTEKLPRMRIIASGNLNTEIFREVEQDEKVIDQIAAAQREDGSAASPQAA